MTPGERRVRPCRTDRSLAGRCPFSLLPILLALLAGTLLLAAGGEAPVEPPPAPFRDITAQSGITFIHSSGATGEKLLPETMGGGVAFFDYDGDGDSDLLFVDSAGRHTGGRGAVLYQNDGNGGFRDVTEETGLAAALRIDPEDPYGTFYGQGVAAADYDGDGRIDLYLTAAGRNRLLRNVGGTFRDVTEEAGAGGGAVWSTGAAFFDADGDGDLDLFVCNYLEWSPELDRSPEKIAERTVAAADGRKLLTYGRPQTYRGAHPYLFLNRGDGTFTEVAEKAGLHVNDPASGAPVAKALAVAPIDVDRDGLPGLFIADDTTRNLFFHNRGPGEDGLPRFEETGELYGLAYDAHGNTTGAMGVDWGHLDGGSELALLVGNFANEATSLYRAQGDPTFYADEALQLGIATPTRKPLTFGLLLLDYDLDGRLDLLQANGHVESHIQEIDPAQRHAQAPQLFWNAGRAPTAGPRSAPRFVEVPASRLGDLAQAMVGRGAAYADIDADGDPDLALTQIDGPARLLRNDQQTGHRWLRLRLEDRAPNLHALGATLEITTANGTQRRELLPTRSYLSQVETDIALGLGPQAKHKGTHQVVVTWPDGTRETFSIRDLDRLQVLERGRGSSPVTTTAD